MNRADNTIQGMYEDMRLRESMTDDEANTLFGWAESEIVRLDTTHTDDDTFYVAVDALFDTLAGIDGFVGARAVDSEATTMNAQTVRETFAPQLEKIAQLAGSAGYAVDGDGLKAWAAAHHLDDNVAAIQSLTAALNATTGANEGVSSEPTLAASSSSADVTLVGSALTDSTFPNQLRDNPTLDFIAAQSDPAGFMPDAPTQPMRPQSPSTNLDVPNPAKPMPSLLRGAKGTGKVRAQVSTQGVSQKSDRISPLSSPTEPSSDAPTKAEYE